MQESCPVAPAGPDHCVHHWVFPQSSGLTSKGKCQKCGAEKECLNTLEPVPFILSKEGKENMRRGVQLYEDRKDEIIATYRKYKESVGKAATALDIPIGTLYGLLYRWGVKDRPVRKPKKVVKEPEIHRDPAHQLRVRPAPRSFLEQAAERAEVAEALGRDRIDQAHQCVGMYQKAWRLFLKRLTTDDRKQWGVQRIKQLVLECLIDAGGK